jgi:hypothetical protein
MFLINHPSPARTMLFSLGFFPYLVCVAASFCLEIAVVRSFSVFIRHSPSFPFLPSHCRPSECSSFSSSLFHLPPEDHHVLLSLLPLQHQPPLASSDASFRDEPCSSKAPPLCPLPVPAAQIELTPEPFPCKARRAH